MAHHHETSEALLLREAWNARMSGLDAVAGEDPAKDQRFNMPTPAGTVMLSLGDLSAMPASHVLPAAENEPPHSRMSFTTTPGFLAANWLKKGGLQKHDSAGSKRRKRKGSEASDGSAPSDVGTAETGSYSRSAGRRPSILVASVSVSEDDLAEQVPPLTAEDSKARATRTALIVEYAFQTAQELRMARSASERAINTQLSA